MLDSSHIDAGFELIRVARIVRERRDEIGAAEFWRALNPALTISDRPFARTGRHAAIDPRLVARAREQLIEDGYCETPPLVPDAVLAPMRAAVARVVAAGFPSGMACVYDEFYQLFEGLDEWFAPILGDRYRLVLHGMWAYFVPPGDSAYGLLTTGSVHRDGLGPDPAVLARGVPSILSVWMPLTDATPIDSCIYALPASADRDFYTAERAVHPETIRVQDVRALPVAAGSVLAWSSHLLHWSSRASRFGRTRVAAGVYFQRADVPLFHPFALDFSDPAPFETRLSWIADSMGMPDLFRRPD